MKNSLSSHATPESLADLVYRSSLTEGASGIRKASPWTVPLSCLLYAGLFGAAWFLVRTHKAVQATVARIVDVDLADSGGSSPGREAGPRPAVASAPVPAAAPKAPDAAVPAPALPPPVSEPVPQETPRTLPQQDLSRLHGAPEQGTPFGATQAGGSGTGTGAGVGTGTGTGSGSGTGAGTGSGSGHRILDREFSQVSVVYQPPAPPYPEMARKARIQGQVTVVIIIGTDGVPVSAEATDGPLPLRKTARNYAMAWRFAPATLDGAPVMARFTLRMPFHLQ